MKQKILIVCVAVLAVLSVLFASLYFGNSAVLTGEKNKLSDDLAAKTKEVRTLESDYKKQGDSHTKAIQAKDKEITTLTAEKDQLIADHAIAIEGKDGEITALTEANTALSGEVAALTETNTTLTGEVTALTEANTALEGEKAALAGEVAALTEANTTLEGEKADLADKMEKLIADYEAAIEKKSSEAVSLFGEVTALAGKKVTLEDDIARMIKEHEEAIAAKNGEIEKLTGEKEALETEKTQLTNDLQKLMDEKKELEDQLASAILASQDLIGVWSVDLKSMLMSNGVMTEEEYESVKDMLATMEYTIEFTADGRAIMRGTVDGEETAAPEEIPFTFVEEGKLLLEGVECTYVIEGDTMNFVEGEVGFVMTRK